MLQHARHSPLFAIGLILCSIIATVTYSHVLATAALAIYDSPGPLLFAGVITSSAGALLSFFHFNNRWRNGFNALLVAAALSAAGMYLPGSRQSTPTKMAKSQMWSLASLSALRLTTTLFSASSTSRKT